MVEARVFHLVLVKAYRLVFLTVESMVICLAFLTVDSMVFLSVGLMVMRLEVPKDVLMA